MKSSWPVAVTVEQDMKKFVVLDQLFTLESLIAACLLTESYRTTRKNSVQTNNKLKIWLNAFGVAS